MSKISGPVGCLLFIVALAVVSAIGAWLEIRGDKERVREVLREEGLIPVRQEEVP